MKKRHEIPRNARLFVVGGAFLVSWPALAEVPGWRGQGLTEELADEQALYEAVEEAASKLAVVPEVPAALSLGLGTEAVARPQDLTAFLVQIANAVDIPDSGNFRSGVSAEIAPLFVSIYRDQGFEYWREMSRAKRWVHAVAESLRLSFATSAGAPASEGGPQAASAAAGLRLSLLNTRDYRFWNVERANNVFSLCAPPRLDYPTGSEELGGESGVCRSLEDAYGQGQLLELAFAVSGTYGARDAEGKGEWGDLDLPVWLAYQYDFARWVGVGVGAQIDLVSTKEAPNFRAGGRLELKWKSALSGRVAVSAAASALTWDAWSMIAALSATLSYAQWFVQGSWVVATDFADLGDDLDSGAVVLNVGFGSMAVPVYQRGVGY